MSTAVEYFKENLLKIMKEHGMSQKELAKKVDIVPQALNKYLKGHRIPGLEIIDKFAQALHLNPHILIANPKANPQIYLSKDEVYEAFMKAHQVKNKECALKGLNKEQQQEIEGYVKNMGGWPSLLSFLKEEFELRQQGQKTYIEVRENIMGPHPAIDKKKTKSELVTTLVIKDKEI